MKATLGQIQEDMDFASDRISGQVRLASVSLLAVTWGLLIGEPSALASVTQQYQPLLLIVGELAMLALAFDFLQYVVGYKLSKGLHDTLTAKGEVEGYYDYTSLWWRARYYLFWGKQFLMILSIALFLFLVGAYILADPSGSQAVNS